MREQHGAGLVNLYHPSTNQINMLAARPKRESQRLQAEHEKRLNDCDPDTEDCIAIANEYIGYDETAAWWYGFVLGSQYTSNSEFLTEFSNCFYVSYDVINSMDAFVGDILDFLNSVEFFQILIYDPIRIYGNIEAAYEYCTFNIYLEQLDLLTSLDWGYLGEVVVRDALLFSLEFTPYWEDYQSYIADDDLYNAGYVFGEFWKLVFDSPIQA